MKIRFTASTYVDHADGSRCEHKAGDEVESSIIEAGCVASMMRLGTVVECTAPAVVETKSAVEPKADAKKK